MSDRERIALAELLVAIGKALQQYAAALRAIPVQPPAPRDRPPSPPPSQRRQDEQQLALTVNEAAKLARISRSQLYLEISARRLIAKKRGKRTLILREDLDAWLASLPSKH